MVLQRGKNIPVWGWADPGEQIKASLAGQHFEVVANADGKWILVFSQLH